MIPKLCTVYYAVRSMLHSSNTGTLKQFILPIFHSIKECGTILAGNAPYSIQTFTLGKKIFYTEVVQYLQIHALVIWIHISITQLHCKQPRKISRDPCAFIYTYLYKDKLHQGNMKQELHCTSE